MPALAPDPLQAGGIAGFGRRLRSGAISAEAATAAYLARIEALEPRLGAFEHVAAGHALATARAMDRLLSAGTDLGPLMGVPVALKDLIAVDGMPTTAGSNLPVADLIGPEGPFVKRLEALGCVVIGKTRTVEFARGASGINSARGTPWNPWDAARHRAPGGSSSGSAVAMAAGLSGFTIGTDTGGSVRTPAAFCGVFGQKTTKGLWSTGGMMPTAPSFDTIGLLTRSAADAALAFAAIEGTRPPPPRPLGGLRLGRPPTHFFEDMDPAVERCVEAALAAIEEAGATLVPVDVSEMVAARLPILQQMVTPECLAVFGRERFLAEQQVMDPLTVARTLPALDVTVDDCIRMRWRQQELCRLYAERMGGFDAWLTPTVGLVPPTVADITDLTGGLGLEGRLGLNTHGVSFCGLCATTQPIHMLGSELPVGLQVISAGGDDAGALAVARAVEDLFGPPPVPDLGGFTPAAP